MVELESQFPFNSMPAAGQDNSSSDSTGPLFGIGRALFLHATESDTARIFGISLPIACSRSAIVRTYWVSCSNCHSSTRR